MDALALAGPVDRVAADTGFSSVVRVDRDGEARPAKAYGLAHRGWAWASGGSSIGPRAALVAMVAAEVGRALMGGPDPLGPGRR